MKKEAFVIAALRDLADQKEGTAGRRVDDLMLREMEAIRDLPSDQRDDHLAEIVLALATVTRGVEAVYTAAISE